MNKCMHTFKKKDFSQHTAHFTSASMDAYARARSRSVRTAHHF